jgi:hypothetical protein
LFGCVVGDGGGSLGEFVDPGEKISWLVGTTDVGNNDFEWDGEETNTDAFKTGNPERSKA